MDRSGGIDWPLGSITIDPAQTPIDPATRQPPITLNADLGGLSAIGTETPPDPIISGDPWTLAMEWTSTSDRLPALDVQWEWAPARAGGVLHDAAAQSVLDRALAQRRSAAKQV